MKVRLSSKKQTIIHRNELKNTEVDTGGRDIFMAFNEPKFKFSQKGLREGDLDVKLNARFPTYFLPAIYIARQQKQKIRLWLVSGLNMSLKWNAKSEKQKKIMIVNNKLKFDFLQSFFEYFFMDVFSNIEYVTAQDPIKISEQKLLALWDILEKQHPEKMKEIKAALLRFTKSKNFGYGDGDVDFVNGLKYTASHIFVFGDVNFEGDYIHNDIGYVSIGGYQEKFFNDFRILAFDLIKDIKEFSFDRNVILRENMRLIIDTEIRNCPPYNGYFKSYGCKKKKKQKLDEVSYENGYDLDFYDQHPKLKFDMEYLYENFINQSEYQKFWSDYKEKYFVLKNKLSKAYGVEF